MFTDLIEQIPGQIHLIVGGCFLAGLIIWAFGHRLLRSMMVLSGIVSGAALGFVLAGFLPEAIPFYLPVLGVAGFWGLIALTAYRFAMSWTLALCLMLACPLGYYTYTELAGTYEGQPGEPLTAEDLMLPFPTTDSPADNPKDALEAELTREAIRKAKEKARAKMDDIFSGSAAAEEGNSEVGEGDNGAAAPLIPAAWRQTLRDTLGLIGTTASNHWQDAPGGQKFGIIVTALGGLVGGFIAGAFIPSASAAIVTAFSGALIMLISGFWLAATFALPVVESVKPQSATASLAWWLSVSVVGLVVQLILRRRARRTKASKKVSGTFVCSPGREGR